MQARLGERVHLRRERFGGIVYVPRRDDFFACTHEVFSLLSGTEREWRSVAKGLEAAYIALAKLGVCETRRPTTTAEAYSGPSFLGRFVDVPTIAEPLVLNCFASAHCPLKCVYCHADDLMQQYRAGEIEDDLDNVVATTNAIPAIVAVITGGDPITRPERARSLIERLSGSKHLVLDTSGVGDIEGLLPVLLGHNVHVRISLDAISDVNDKFRPINRLYVKGSSSGALAQRAILACVEAGVPVTVQSVVTAKTESLDGWLDLRDWLVHRGVRNWVLHLAVKAGKARLMEEKARARQARPRGLLPGELAYERLRRLLARTASDAVPIDIRITDTDGTPNSVLLVSSRGDLFTEGFAHNGKVRLYEAGSGRPDLIRAKWAHVDQFGHARRYLNLNPWLLDGTNLEDLCVDVPLGRPSASRAGLVETETKYAVHDTKELRRALRAAGFRRKGGVVTERDEYYDTKGGALSGLDCVVRMRRRGDEVLVAMKLPRFFLHNQGSSRIEVEFTAKSEAEVEATLERHSLVCSWFFEKRREVFAGANGICVCIDTVPLLGAYLEIEGPVDKAATAYGAVSGYVGGVERRNYKELFVDHMQARGHDPTKIDGVSFDTVGLWERPARA